MYYSGFGSKTKSRIYFIIMRKFKDLRFNEKLLIALLIMLLVGILIRWPQVKEGFFKGWERFGFAKTEKVE